MKYMIASDIHGSAYYCEKMLEAYEREKADRLILLGDLLYHGPRNDLPRDYAPKKVAEYLNGYKDSLLCVRGNCDAEVDQHMLMFPVMADYAIFQCGENIIFAAHGHIWNPSKLPPLKTGDILLNGHTHIPACERREGFIYMNPGSISIPKENSAHGYMVWEGKEFVWKNIDGESYMETHL